jgi:hypothetical protein
MGESIFIEPVKQWLKRNKTTKARTMAIPEAPIEEDELASLRDIFDLDETSAISDTLEIDGTDYTLDIQTAGVKSGTKLEELNARLQALDAEKARLMAQINGGNDKTEGVRQTPVLPVGQVQRAEVLPTETQDIPTANAFSTTTSEPAQDLASDLNGSSGFQGLDSLPGNLKGAFSSAIQTNPLVHDLSQRRKGIMMQELSDELYDFVRKIGALGGGR